MIELYIELTDAVRQKRQPDPNIVPVEPRAPSKQNPKVAVNRLTKSETESSNDNGSNVIGPEKPATCIIIDDDKNKPSIKEEEVEDDNRKRTDGRKYFPSNIFLSGFLFAQGCKNGIENLESVFDAT